MLWNECEDEILIAVTQQICKNITHLPYKLFCHLLSDINDYTFDICLCFTLSLFNFQVKPLTNFNRLYVFKTITTFPSVSISIALPSMHIECSPFAFFLVSFRRAWTQFIILPWLYQNEVFYFVIFIRKKLMS